ncbi:ATP-binding protein [Enterococcus termitis]
MDKSRRNPFCTSIWKRQVTLPLLIFSKEQLTAFAEQEAIRYFEDSSNLSDDYMRNRIRHHVIPILKKKTSNFYSISLTLASKSVMLKK